MKNIEIYFDGYCPESQLRGKSVAMRLNQDDFWESPETGLQITIFPPYATILRWRGKGVFRQSSDGASDLPTGLVMTKPRKDEGKGIFPDQQNLIHNEFELQEYCNEIYESMDDLKAANI